MFLSLFLILRLLFAVGTTAVERNVSRTIKIKNMKRNDKSRSYVKPQMTVIEMEPERILAGTYGTETQNIDGGTWDDWEEDEIITSSESTSSDNE